MMGGRLLVSALGASLVLHGCTSTVDLTKEERAYGSACDHDPSVSAQPFGTSQPFVRVERTIELPDASRAVSVAGGDDLVLVLTDVGNFGERSLLGLDADGREILRWSVPGQPWSLHLAGKRAVTVNLARGNPIRVDVDSGQTLALERLGDEPRGLALSSDGGRVYQPLTLVTEIGVIDVESGEEVCRIPVVSGVSSAIALSRDGKRLFVGYGGGGGSSYHAGIEVLDRETGETLGLLPLGNSVGELSLAPDESSLAALVGLRDDVLILDPSTLSERGSVPLPGVGDGIAWHGGHAYVWSWESRAVWVVDIGQQAVIATVDVPINPAGVAFVHDVGYVVGDEIVVLGR